MKSLLAFLLVLVVQTFAGSSQACTLAQPSGSVGNTNNPATGYITDIVANGTANLTVTYGGTVSNTVTLGSSSGITVTGSWHGTKITSLAASRSTLSINGVVALTTTGATSSGSLSFGTGGVTQVRGGVAGYNSVYFDGIGTSGPQTYAYKLNGTCTASISTTVDTLTQGFKLTVTAAGATSVSLYLDGGYVGDVAGPSPMVGILAISSFIYPGVRHVTYDVTWPNGSLVNIDGGSRNYYPLRVSTNSGTSCAVKGGTTYCWGLNTYGEIGNGTTGGFVSSRVAVTGLGTGTYNIATANETTCAVQSGGVKCWGQNLYNVLQNGTGVPSNVPVQVVPANSGIIQVGLGYGFACTLSNIGAVQCWGRGVEGQMGNGTYTSPSPKVTPTGMGSGVSTLSVGSDSVCSIKDGVTKCWGGNGFGQIGNNSLIAVNVPTAPSWGVAPYTVDVAVGDHLVCATDSNLNEYCWGKNDQHGTGTPSAGSIKVPSLVPLSGSALAFVGNQTACTVIVPPTSVNYTPMCWGANDYGQLGRGFISDHEDPASAPTNVPYTLSGSAGGNTVCAVTSGHLKCWGANYYGQVGAGTGLPDMIVTPTLVTGF